MSLSIGTVYICAALYYHNHIKKQRTQIMIVFSLLEVCGMAAEAKPWQNLCDCSRPTLSNAVITLSYDDHQDQRNKHTVPPLYYIRVVTF